jgi:hypothetical protein
MRARAPVCLCSNAHMLLHESDFSVKNHSPSHQHNLPPSPSYTQAQVPSSAHTVARVRFSTSLPGYKTPSCPPHTCDSGSCARSNKMTTCLLFFSICTRAQAQLRAHAQLPPPQHTHRHLTDKQVVAVWLEQGLGKMITPLQTHMCFPPLSPALIAPSSISAIARGRGCRRRASVGGAGKGKVRRGDMQEKGLDTSLR